MSPATFSRTIDCFRLFVSVLLVCTTLSSAAANSEDEHVFPALGTLWRTYDIKWIEVEKQWMIDATVEEALPVGYRATGPQLLAVFCKQLVQAKPNAPDITGESFEIFRVNLKVIGPQKRLLWSTVVPVQVRANECQIKEGGQRFFIRYPGALKGWRFHSVTIQKMGDIYRRQYTFEPDEGENLNIQEFDFDQGCRVTLKDPAVQLFDAKVMRQYATIAVEPATVVIAAKQAAKQGMFIGFTYKIVDGKCVKE